MPVTAKLSRKFYDRLGDDIDARFDRFEATADRCFDEQIRQFDRVEATMDRLFDEQIRLMIVLWLATVIPLGGLMIGLVSTLP